MAINKDVYELELVITDAQKTVGQFAALRGEGESLLDSFRHLITATKGGLVDKTQLALDIKHVKDLVSALATLDKKLQSVKNVGAARAIRAGNLGQSTLSGVQAAGSMSSPATYGQSPYLSAELTGSIKQGKWLAEVLAGIANNLNVPVNLVKEAIREARKVVQEQLALASKQSKTQTTRLGMDAALSAARTDANQGKGGVTWRMPLNAALADAQKTSKEIGSNWKGIQSTIGGAHTANKGFLSTMKESLLVAVKWYTIYSGFRMLINGIQGAYRALVTDGLAFYKAQEQQTLGLRGIIAANFVIKDSTGKQVEGMEKINATTRIAQKTWKELQALSFSVVGTTEDLLNIYNAILPRVAQMGGNLKDALNLTSGTVLAATGLGISFATARTSIVSILNGNVRMSNQFTAALGISEEQVKKLVRQNKLVEELNIRFKPFVLLQRQSAGLFQALTESFRELRGFAGSTIFKPIIEGLKTVILRIQDMFGEIKDGTFVFDPKALTFLNSLRNSMAAVIPYAEQLYESIKSELIASLPVLSKAFRDALPAIATLAKLFVSLITPISLLISHFKGLIPLLVVIALSLSKVGTAIKGTATVSLLAEAAVTRLGTAFALLKAKLLLALPVLAAFYAAEKLYDMWQNKQATASSKKSMAGGKFSAFSTIISDKLLTEGPKEVAAAMTGGTNELIAGARILLTEYRALIKEKAALAKQMDQVTSGKISGNKAVDIVQRDKDLSRRLSAVEQEKAALESLGQAAEAAGKSLKEEGLTGQSWRQLVDVNAKIAEFNREFTAAEYSVVAGKPKKGADQLRDELKEEEARLKKNLAVKESVWSMERDGAETSSVKLRVSGSEKLALTKYFLEQELLAVNKYADDQKAVLKKYENILLMPEEVRSKQDEVDTSVVAKKEALNKQLARIDQDKFTLSMQQMDDYNKALTDRLEQQVNIELEIKRQQLAVNKITAMEMLEAEEKAAEQLHYLRTRNMMDELSKYVAQPEKYNPLKVQLDTEYDRRAADEKLFASKKQEQAYKDAQAALEALIETNKIYISGQRTDIEFAKERGTILESTYISRLKELNEMEMRNNKLEQKIYADKLKRLELTGNDIEAQEILKNKIQDLNNAYKDLQNTQIKLISTSDQLIKTFTQFQEIFASFADTNFGAGIDRFLAGAAKLLPKLSRGVGGASFFGANFAPQPRGYSYIPMPGLGGTPGAGAPQGGGISSFFKSISGGVVAGFDKVFKPENKTGGKLTGASKVFGIMGNIANIAGAAGSIISSVMAVVDIFKAVFSRAARKIAANIEKDFTTIMSSFNAGTSNLINTISSLEAQRASAIAQLSSKKGGQEQLNKLLPTIDDALASLRKQQTQIFQNFEKSLFVLQQPKGIRTVVQQFQQLAETVKEYLDAGGDATKANKYLSISLQDLKDNAFNELAQAEKDAVDRAIELNDLQKQRLDIVKEYAEKEAAILGRGSIERQLPLILQGARELQKIRQERDDKLADLDRQITITKDRVAGEREIFDITTDIASLRQKSIQLEMEMNRKIIEQLKEQKVLVTSTWGALYNSVAMALPNLNRPSAPVLPSGSDLPGNSQDQNNYMQEWSRSMGNYKTAAGGTEVNITLENISVSGVRDTAQAISIGQTVGTEIASQLEVRLRRRAIL